MEKKIIAMICSNENMTCSFNTIYDLPSQNTTKIAFFVFDKTTASAIFPENQFIFEYFQNLFEFNFKNYDFRKKILQLFKRKNNKSNILFFYNTKHIYESMNIQCVIAFLSFI